MKAELDHLVVAAPSLDAGVRWCEATLGVTPGPGGRHDFMGTHNRLLRIGEAAYLEIIAIDPDAPAPGRARWFGLDGLDLSGGPRLVHGVARTDAIEPALAALHAEGIDAGRVLDASRATPDGVLRWRIAVRDDGALPPGPTLIEWSGRHPTAAMPASGVTLRAFTLRGVAPAVRRTIDWRGIHIDDNPGPALEAHFETPRGMIVLTST